MRSPCSVPDWFRAAIPLETSAQQDVCRRHDADYFAGGSRRDRLMVDLNFLYELLAADMDPDTAEKYFLAVRWYGGASWADGDLPGAVPPPQPVSPEAP